MPALLLGCLVFYAIPFILVFLKSVTKGIGKTQKFVGTDHNEAMFENEVFVRAFGNTIKFLVIVLPLIILFAFVVALILKEQARRHQCLKSAILLPFIMPVVGTELDFYQKRSHPIVCGILFLALFFLLLGYNEFLFAATLSLSLESCLLILGTARK